MANKYFRKNLNKGGGADSGRMGEIKSKLAVAGMKAKDVMGKSPRGLTQEQIDKLKKLLKREGNFMKPLRELKGPAKPLRRNLNKGGGADYMNTVKPRKRGNPPVLPKTKREKRMGGGSMMMQRPMMNKGGSLKPVDKEKNPGLAKLPTKVRNKMGYMKKGGEVKKLMTPKERAEYVKKAKVSLGATAESLMDKNQPKKRDRLFQKYGK